MATWLILADSNIQKGLSDAQRDLLVANNERKTTMKEVRHRQHQQPDHSWTRHAIVARLTLIVF